MICGARFERFAEACVEVVLFLVAEDAARESSEVVGSIEEAGYSWDVDDVCADIQRKWKGNGFHFGVSGCWCGLSGSCGGSEVVCRKEVAAEVLETSG